MPDDALEAENARLRDELERMRGAMTPGPFQNHTVTESERRAAEAEKSKRTWDAVKEGEKREAQARAERERAEREAGRQRLEDHLGRAHQQLLANGGSEADWPGIRARLREQYLTEQASTDPKERAVQEAMEKLKASGQYSRF